jgi:hypothetical protein
MFRNLKASDKEREHRMVMAMSKISGHDLGYMENPEIKMGR